MQTVIWRVLIGAFLIAHGLIHSSYGTPTPPAGPIKWPFDLSHSWLLSNLGMGPGGLHFFGTMLWITATVAFCAAGLGVFGLPGFYTWWRTLAVLGAVLSLALLILYWQPMLVLGVAIDLAILLALIWTQWPPVQIARV